MGKQMDVKYIVIIVVIVIATLLIIILPPSILAGLREREDYSDIRAMASISSSMVSGTVIFEQDDPPDEETIVKINLRLNPGNTEVRGIHVHEFGLTGNDCLDARGHYNPENMSHGNVTGFPRHIGDLGNINFFNGVFNRDIVVKNLPLGGPMSIVGRTVVVHAQMDDLGLGGDEESLTTGNSGPPIGCGVIAIVPIPDT